MRSRLRRVLGAAASAVALAAALAAEAGDSPVYSLSSPGVTPLYVAVRGEAVDPVYADWAASNAAVAPAAGAFDRAASEESFESGRETDPAAPVRTLESVIAGFPAERNKPLYYLGDALIAPEGVDWDETYRAFAADAEIQDNFLFDTKNNAVYVTLGETVKFPWVVADATGALTTNAYPIVASPVAGERPKNIFWTDARYGGRTVDVTGKFVKFFGPSNLLTKVMGKESTGTSVGGEMSYRDVVVSGLYVEESGGTKTVYAAGELKGQVVMAYYDSANYDRIVDVQTIEVSQPQTDVRRSTVGAELTPSGRGYDIAGLEASPTTLDDFDAQGPFLYQHQGLYAYSPKNGSVFALRPSDDTTRNQTQIYWMEADRQGVSWPFEVDEYLVSWPDDAAKFVRGDDANAPGRGIRIPDGCTAELMKWQADGGSVVNHARAVVDGEFVTYGPGRSLLKLTGDDNVWFLPVESILRTDATWFDLSVETLVKVGSAVELRGGSVSGLAPGRTLAVNATAPGYVYEPKSDPVWNPAIYSADGTAADGLPSVVYPVTASMSPAVTNRIEVWWSSQVELAGLAKPISVPSLPQVYAVDWPQADEAPQIVIASQLGSAGESSFCDGASLVFDSTNAYVELPMRQFFGARAGAIMLWTRPYDETALGKDSALLTLRSTNGTDLVTLDLVGGSFVATVGSNRLELAGAATKDWRYLALGWNDGQLGFLALGDGFAESATAEVSEALMAQLAEPFGECWLGAKPGSGKTTAPMRILDEIQTWNRAMSVDEFKTHAALWTAGDEPGLSFFLPILRGGTDLVTDGATDVRYASDLVLGTRHRAVGCLKDLPGAPHAQTSVITSDHTPTLYRQPDPDGVGYNPNEEHAFLQAGQGGWVAWALRCDLNDASPDGAVSKPGVLVAYDRDGVRMMKYFHVLPTNGTYSAFADTCTVGRQLPGPKPLLLFDDPWLKETCWDPDAAPPFRDRKGQVWARCAGEFAIGMYYARQSDFDWPPGLAAPAVGAAVPWLSYLDGDAASPQPWVWRVAWPETASELKLGQMLTTAEDGLPEMWNAKSMAVLYPISNAHDVVMLSDPTVARSAELGFTSSRLAELGLKTGPGEQLLDCKGLYRFQGVSPSLSQRLYIDPTTDRLVLQGVKESNAGGVELIYVNVLSAEDVASVKALVQDFASAEPYAPFIAALDALAGLGPAEPTAVGEGVRDGLLQTVAVYQAPDHYALTAMGMTNWVVMIENDATNDFCDAGNPVNMHVLRVVPKYHVGRVVTREDPNNLLSQVMGVHYAQTFGGDAGGFVFDWRRASPGADGSVPTDYDNESVYRPKFSAAEGVGKTEFTVGGQGDTLANMVNAYYACRYRAADTNSPAYAVMGETWSDWSDPPALAEGWVQRVLNNVTPFTQRMTDLYNNEVETAVSWMQQAGKPYTGDVALNQDNLTSVGLIELYRTILNKAESMSLLQGVNDADANQQLMLAVERLGDLYTMLGDEAYADAANPTIGFGSNFGESEAGLGIDYGAASSSLFAFDNQVPTLLDEELALLRGRSCVNAPGNTIGPYYNRLIWNFTKGITAGEVAYAVNYNISGHQVSTIDESVAAELYPQGHGDAYGHYLSALQGWYRLLRNPYFSWGSPGMGEMNVADNVVNVDYYDEAKFADAAAAVARTAQRTVELTALKAWRDHASDATGGGYLDDDAENAFGYGEWASRGAFGALCNWAVANSLLPEEEKLDGSGVAYADRGLLHIDRGTVTGIGELASAAEAIQQTVDRMDAGMNPLGLDDATVPFDLTPIGSAGDQTHYEQIRERATGAFDNAKRILDRAQEYSNRLRMLEETRAGIVDNLDSMEDDLTAQLIALYGRPYADDIGPGKTYPSGYYGPDLYHYMWMDLGAYGLNAVEDTLVQTNVSYRIQGYDANGEISAIGGSAVGATTGNVLAYSLSANGLVVKPASVQGERPASGELQLAYADFLSAYGAFTRAMNAYNRKAQNLDDEWKLLQIQAASASAYGKVADKVYGDDGLRSYISKLADEKKSLVAMNAILRQLDIGFSSEGDIQGNVGLATTIATDAIKSAAGAALMGVNLCVQAVKSGLEGDIADCEEEISLLNLDLAAASYKYSSVVSRVGGWETLISSVETVNSALGTVKETLQALQSSQERVSKLVQQGRAILETRELNRQQAVNNIAKMRYNDTFFRKLRNETLSKYECAFGLARQYAFLAAKAYAYETGSSMDVGTAGGDLLRQIVGARALGETDGAGQPIVSDNGDAGIAGALAKLDANWRTAKTQLGINNPQPYATWFSLRHGLFRILAGELGDDAWQRELAKYWCDDITGNPEFVRHCLPFVSQFGLADQEPGLIIPFETTIDFAKNLFGKDLAFDDAQFDSSWYATKISAAGVWFEGYNEKREGYTGASAFSTTPNVYLVPVGTDRMREPGSDGETITEFNVVDQTVPVPYALTAGEIAEANRLPLYTDGDFGGVDAVTRIRRHPSFRAYYGATGTEPTDAQLDATRLTGRSVWNTRWLLVIPAGTLNANREQALKSFICGLDADRDGVVDVLPVRDIRIGFKTYSNSGK
ncbi:MAG: hypothetical protein ACI4R9_05005 [Kiritimatiellia bacterium]